MNFGAWLRDLRKKNHLSRGAFRLRVIKACGHVADKIISVSCIRDLENGKNKWPNEETENQITETVSILKVRIPIPKKS